MIICLEVKSFIQLDCKFELISTLRYFLLFFLVILFLVFSLSLSPSLSLTLTWSHLIPVDFFLLFRFKYTVQFNSFI